MSFDFRLDPVTRDLSPGWVFGPDEIVQRLMTRLKRELGEWFLAANAGLPWYQDGRGILGSRAGTRKSVELLVRREALNTEGVVRVVRCNTVFSSRAYSMYLEVFVAGAGILPVRVDGETAPCSASSPGKCADG